MRGASTTSALNATSSPFACSEVAPLRGRFFRTAWRVFVVEGGRANARAVTLKHRNADQAWIDGGLKAGESVVLYPGSMVADGQSVKVAK